MVVLGGPEELSDVLIETSVARSVSRELPGKSSAEAVAILSDARVGLEEAAGCLVPGGIFYWEVESGRLRTKKLERWVSDRLRRARLSPTGIYWVRPDFERCESFIPVDLPTALKWYLRTFSSRRVLASRLGAATAALVIGRLVQRCAVTAVAAPLRAACPSILDNKGIPADAREGGARPLVINRGGRDGSRRSIVFPFSAESAKPSVVVKFSRLAGRNAAMEHEQRITTEIRSRLDPEMRQSIPAPLGTFAWGNLIAGVETYAGKPLSDRSFSRRRSRIEVLDLATRWLLEFHRQTNSGAHPLSPSQFEAWVEAPVRAYMSALGATEEEEDLFERLRRRARSLTGCPLPLVWSHTAFSEFNVCRSGNRIAVIDWEGVCVGPPLIDLIYFVTVWHYRSEGARGDRAQLDSFRKLFFSPSNDVLVARARAGLEEYMRRLSIDARFFPVMLLLTWVARALGRLERQHTFGSPRPDRRKENLHADRVRILAEHRDELFPEKTETP
jgi:aminoglycoside phosphotransferase (APT) family kinase protein